MDALISHHLPACMDGFSASCSLTRALSCPAIPSPPTTLGLPPRRAAGSYWQKEACLLLLPSTPGQACGHRGWFMSGMHPKASGYGARQWLFLPWAGSTISHPAGNSVGTPYSLPSSYWECPSTEVVVPEGLPISHRDHGPMGRGDWLSQLGHHVFSFHGLCQLCSLPAIQTTVTSKPLFPMMLYKVGDHAKQSVSVRSEGFIQPHARSPDRNLAASPEHLWDSASAAGDISHSSCPSGSFDHVCVIPLLPSLPVGQSLCFIVQK